MENRVEDARGTDEEVNDDGSRESSPIKTPDRGSKRSHETEGEKEEDDQPPKKKFLLPDIKSKKKEWELPDELADFFEER